MRTIKSGNVSLLLFEDEPEYCELHEHGDAHHDDRCYEAVYAQLHAAPEEHYVQTEVDAMASGETNELLPRRLLSEGEQTCGVEVRRKAHDIADGVCCVHLYQQLQEEINAVVYACGEYAVEDKAYELRLALVIVFYG